MESLPRTWSDETPVRQKLKQTLVLPSTVGRASFRDLPVVAGAAEELPFQAGMQHMRVGGRSLAGDSVGSMSVSQRPLAINSQQPCQKVGCGPAAGKW